MANQNHNSRRRLCPTLPNPRVARQPWIGSSNARQLRFESLEDRVLLAADLVANGISLSDTTVDPGQSVNVTWTARNIGNSATGFYPLGTSQQGVMWSTNNIISTGDTLLEKEFLGWLNDGSSSPEVHTINIPANATPGQSYWIGVIADYDGDISESNEANNNDGAPVRVTINQADLVVNDIEMDGQSTLPDVRSGDTVRLDFEVENIGTATTINDVHMRWYWGTAPGSTANYIAEGSLGTINGLSPGETETESDGFWTIPALFPGDYWLTGVIDWDHRVNESDEGNNERSESFRVLPPLRPDLVVNDIEMDGESSLPDVRSGDTVRLDFEVENIGNAPTSADVHMRWYWGTTQGATTNYIAEGSLGTIDGLSPGETETESDGFWTIPALFPGDYWVTGVIDWDNQVTESNEGNNSRSESFTVLPGLLSWRDGNTSNANIVTTIDAGQSVWANVQGDPGEEFVIDVWEDDGALGDDKIESFTITVGAQGFGTHEWKAAWQGVDGDGPQNAYYLFHDAFGPSNLESFLLDVSMGPVPSVNSFSTPLTYDWGGVDPVEGIIDVTLSRLDSTSTIDLSARTWLVIHGRSGSFTDNDDRVKQLADTLVSARAEDQVLTLDWSEGATYVPGGKFTDFSQEEWLLSVANWANLALGNIGFSSGTNINLVGHSFGAVISGKLAELLGGVNTVLAIDPAEDPPGNGNLPDDVVFGDNNSNYSWSFYSTDGDLGIAGNEQTPTTADEAIVVTNSEHSYLVTLVEDMIEHPGQRVSRYFSLDRLLAHAPAPWLANQYDKDGDEDSGGLYDAVISSVKSDPSDPEIEHGDRASQIEAMFFSHGLVDPGDYDNDNDVDGRDFLVWQRSFGATGSALPADGDFSSEVASGDLEMWQVNYEGSTSTPLSSAMQVAEITDSRPDAIQLTNLSILTLDQFRDDESDSARTIIKDIVFDEFLPSRVGQAALPLERITNENEFEFFLSLAVDDEKTDQSQLTDELLERVFG